MRDTIIAGNWKMNKSPVETKEYFNKFNDLVKESKSKVVLCVPFVDIQVAQESTQNTNISIGAQNMYYIDSGAYTGEISVKMLKDMNLEYVIIGHSERRQYFNEVDDIVNLKIKAALENNIKPILCVGETLEQREKGIQNEIISLQIINALKDIDKEEIKNVIIAYEPVWAIGTGLAATAIDANNSIIVIRNEIANLYGAEVANDICILYGGSIKSENAHELFSMPDIDGGLVGGASLSPEEFAKIVNSI